MQCLRWRDLGKRSASYNRRDSRLLPIARNSAVGGHEKTAGSETYVSQALGHDNEAFAALRGTASGIIYCDLEPEHSQWMLWLREEFVTKIRWSGNPTDKERDPDSQRLGLRKSFAEWSEVVRGTAQPWSAAETAACQVLAARVASQLAINANQQAAQDSMIRNSPTLQDFSFIQGLDFPHAYRVGDNDFIGGD